MGQTCNIANLMPDSAGCRRTEVWHVWSLWPNCFSLLCLEVGITVDCTNIVVRSNVTQSDMSLCSWIGHRADQATAVSNSAQIRSNSEHRESEPTTSKLVEDFDVTASPCYEGYPRHNAIRSTPRSVCLSLFSACALAPPLIHVLRHLRAVS